MPRTPKFVPKRTAKPTLPWVLNVPASVTPDGRQKKEYFANKEDAERRGVELRESYRRQGEGAFGVPVTLREQAVKAAGILEGFDVDLVTVARDWVEREMVRRRSKSFGELMDEFVETLVNRNKSAPYIRDARYAKTRLEPFLNGVMVSEITTKRLREIFLEAGLTPTGQKSMKRNLRAAFSYAVAHEYAATNPAKGLITDDAEEREISTLTPCEARALYEAADDDVKPYVVLATWCGIRPDEVKRLNWEDVKWGRGWVEVKRASSKTRRKRFVEMAENVAVMLEPYRGRKGKVVACSPNAWKLGFKAAREAAGVFDDWQEDTLRHTFASYHIALHNNLDGLARQMGHSGTGTAYQHYLDAVGKAEALEFWRIGLPEAQKRKEGAA